MIAGKVSQEQMSSYNDEASKNYNEKALDQCANCGRTFLPDRLIVHLKSCNKAHGKTADVGMKSPERSGFSKGNLGGGSSNGGGGMGSPSPSQTFKKPKALMCYIW